MDFGRGVKTEQCLAHGLGRQLTHGLLPVKLDLPFGGMDVDINFRRVDFDEKAANRVTSLHQRGVVSFQQSEIEAAILHRASIHKKMLIFASAPGNSGRSHQAPDGKGGRGGRGLLVFFLFHQSGKIHGKIDRQHLLSAARERPQALAQGRDSVGRADSGQLPDGPSIFDEFDGHARPGQRGQSQVVPDVGQPRFLAGMNFRRRGQY